MSSSSGLIWEVPHVYIFQARPVPDWSCIVQRKSRVKLGGPHSYSRPGHCYLTFRGSLVHWYLTWLHWCAVAIWWPGSLARFHSSPPVPWVFLSLESDSPSAGLFYTWFTFLHDFFGFCCLLDYEQIRRIDTWIFLCAGCVVLLVKHYM